MACFWTDLLGVSQICSVEALPKVSFLRTAFSSAQLKIAETLDWCGASPLIGVSMVTVTGLFASDAAVYAVCGDEFSVVAWDISYEYQLARSVDYGTSVLAYYGELPLSEGWYYVRLDVEGVTYYGATEITAFGG